MGMDPMTKEELDVQRKLQGAAPRREDRPGRYRTTFPTALYVRGNNRKIWADRINAQLAANDSPLVSPLPQTAIPTA